MAWALDRYRRESTMAGKKEHRVNKRRTPPSKSAAASPTAANVEVDEDLVRLFMDIGEASQARGVSHWAGASPLDVESAIQRTTHGIAADMGWDLGAGPAGTAPLPARDPLKEYAEQQVKRAMRHPPVLDGAAPLTEQDKSARSWIETLDDLLAERRACVDVLWREEQLLRAFLQAQDGGAQHNYPDETLATLWEAVEPWTLERVRTIDAVLVRLRGGGKGAVKDIDAMAGGESSSTSRNSRRHARAVLALETVLRDLDEVPVDTHAGIARRMASMREFRFALYALGLSSEAIERHLDPLLVQGDAPVRGGYREQAIGIVAKVLGRGLRTLRDDLRRAGATDPERAARAVRRSR